MLELRDLRLLVSCTIQELKRINRARSLTDLEVELWRRHFAGLTRLGNDLAALDCIAALHQQFTEMGICGEDRESAALTEFCDKTEPLWADLYGWRAN